MLLSEARPRPYRQPTDERGYDQDKEDTDYFDELRNRAVITHQYEPTAKSASSLMHAKAIQMINSAIDRELSAR